MSQTKLTAERTVTLHRLLKDWGEGTSNAGLTQDGDGAPSTPNDATWVHTFSTTGRWDNPGGDFVPIASASRNIGNIGFYSWDSDSLGNGGMLNDVKAWLDGTAGNFGWLLQGDEITLQSVKQFDTKEAATRPQLQVFFTPTQSLAVTVNDAGTGSTVTSTPPGIACAPTCEASYADGTPVTLTPHTAANAIFTGWSGACTGTGTCRVPMTQPQAVTAIFTLLRPNQFALMVDLIGGTDGGTVTSTPPALTVERPARRPTTLAPASPSEPPPMRTPSSPAGRVAAAPVPTRVPSR
jgi:hypothetical protein